MYCNEPLCGVHTRAHRTQSPTTRAKVLSTIRTIYSAAEFLGSASGDVLDAQVGNSKPEFLQRQTNHPQLSYIHQVHFTLEVWELVSGLWSLASPTYHAWRNSNIPVHKGVARLRYQIYVATHRHHTSVTCTCVIVHYIHLLNASVICEQPRYRCCCCFGWRNIGDWTAPIVRVAMICLLHRCSHIVFHQKRRSYLSRMSCSKTWFMSTRATMFTTLFQQVNDLSKASQGNTMVVC